MDMETNVGLDFNISKDSTKIIKVIGIGGGGVNSVNYMYNLGIHGVNFAVCNTDRQSFDGVSVPVQVTLGKGLGAGGDPDFAKKEFEKSATEVEKLLTDGTEMVFISSGMGGGTGSGAAPLLAKMAKSKDILTVGIVMIPFLYEKMPRVIQALEAVEEMSKNVDALIVINNELLETYYPDYELEEAFKKPNEVLAIAVKSIAEIITLKGIINRDFNDVKSTMKDSGVALVSYGYGKGENRLDDAIKEALDSPLLSNKDIKNAKRILLYFSFKNKLGAKMREVKRKIDEFMGAFDDDIKMNWGFGIVDSLEKDQDVKFTIIATGFGTEVIQEIVQWKDEEDLQIIREAEQMKIKRFEQVKKYYDVDLSMNIKVHRVSNSSIVILSPDEMDNDEFINFLEKHPTFNRDPNEIAKIRKPAKNTAAKEEQKVEPESKGSKASNIIEF
jgi:cell division protein FtsZ